MTKRALLLLAAMNVIIFGISYLPIPQAHAVGVTLTVTSTGDAVDANAGDGACETATPGECTLRAAIEESNANTGVDTIAFGIAGDGVHTITPATAYPDITDTVTIDGYTQSGAVANTAAAPAPINSVIMIEIDGHQIAGGARNFYIKSNDTVVQGLSLFGFSSPSVDDRHASIAVEADDVSISGNYIGVRADGMTPGIGDNTRGVVCLDHSGLNIGGTNAADRNIIFSTSSTNLGGGIFSQCINVDIYGNYIGMAKDGVTDLSPEVADANQLAAPFTFGAQIQGVENHIGGSSPGMRNLISGNQVNITINNQHNSVQGNYIGTDYTGVVRSTITNGIAVTTSTGDANLIGGVNAGEGNIIAGVKGAGVMINSFTIQQFNMTLNPRQVSVLGNVFKDIDTFDFTGFGTSNLAIDLMSLRDNNDPADFVPDVIDLRGPNTNDEGDADSGPNDLINAPVLKSAVQVGNQLTITYDLDATGASGGLYRVEFYSNSTASIFGAGPGETYLGAVDTATTGTGKTVTLTVDSDETYKSLSATATAKDDTIDRGGNNDGYSSTSEFARNISVGSGEDTDADGVLDAVENAGPNNGDANSDTVLDRLQPTVTTFKSADDTTWETVLTSGCSENSSVSSLGPNAFPKKDANHNYPFGMIDFTLRCSKGDSANVTIYYFTDQGVDSLRPRKLLTATNTYQDLPDSALTQVQLGDRNALRLTYSIADGSAFDDDGKADGLIHDPVGLATNVSPGSTLPTVGVMYVLLPVGLALIFTLLYAYYDYRRHKQPLVSENPHVHYTFWHHLKVVTLPIMRYRLSIVIDRRDPASTAGTVAH